MYNFSYVSNYFHIICRDVIVFNNGWGWVERIEQNAWTGISSLIVASEFQPGEITNHRLMSLHGIIIWIAVLHNAIPDVWQIAIEVARFQGTGGSFSFRTAKAAMWMGPKKR